MFVMKPIATGLVSVDRHFVLVFHLPPFLCAETAVCCRLSMWFKKTRFLVEINIRMELLGGKP